MKEIIEDINNMSGRYHSHTIFLDWIKMFGISIHNQIFFDEKLEKIYLNYANKYKATELDKMCKWSSILVNNFENEIDDYLGKCYMQLNAGNVRTGQFFTPYHLCKMISEISIKDFSNEKIDVIEPSVGSGGNIIALAKTIQKKGYNYQNILNITAEDIDENCIWMAYVQFSLLGIRAKCILGNSLSDKKHLELLTPQCLIQSFY